MSRAKVIRRLASAREVGIVRIRIDGHGSEQVALARRLMASFGLAEATVIPAPASEDDVASAVGHAAGDDLRRVPRIVVAAGGRRKVAAIRAALKATGASVLITEEAAARGLLAG